MELLCRLPQSSRSATNLVDVASLCSDTLVATSSTSSLVACTCTGTFPHTPLMLLRTFHVGRFDSPRAAPSSMRLCPRSFLSSPEANMCICARIVLRMYSFNTIHSVICDKRRLGHAGYGGECRQPFQFRDCHLGSRQTFQRQGF